MCMYEGSKSEIVFTMVALGLEGSGISSEIQSRCYQLLDKQIKHEH